MLTRPDPTRQNPAESWPDPTRPDPRVHPTEHIRTLLTRKAAIWRSLENNKTDQLKSKYTQIVSEAISKYGIDRETIIGC